ncbi:hypothetical protein PTKIN_Ptkin14bG0151100 [Pterospermum kingtungense]
MASSALSSAISTIGDLLTEEAKFLWGVEEQVERLQTELRWMKSFLSLKDADARQGEDERISMWVSEIRELAYDAEDVVEAFALQIGSKRKEGFSNVIKRWSCILKEGWSLHKTRSKIESIIARIADLTRRLQTYGIRELRDVQSSSSSNVRRELRWTYPHIVEDNIVGLSSETKKLVSILVEDDHNHCKVVSICGMGGLGKTTLAKMVYNHSRVRDYFTHFAWVYVSQQYHKRKVWEDALSGLNVISSADLRKMREEELADKLFSFLRDNQSSMNDERLAKKLFDFLKNNKCLVILDDLWSIEDWDVILAGFPINEPQSKSKILITSRNKEVALPEPRGQLHELEFLNPNDSWELFQKIAFQNTNSQDDGVDGRKEDLGRKMVKHCAGLPLAIIVLGGILATKDSFNEWLTVYENVKSYLKISGKGLQRIDEVLSLSYDDLPPYLRPCFLYLCHFPEDYAINAEKLIQLWVAEGIVSTKQDGNGGEIIEDVAERYLVELAERCMIQVRETDLATSKIKTFQMHDLMRDLCLSKAKDENFVFIVDQSNANSSTIIRKVRRVSAHVFFWIQRLKSPNIRSLLFFGELLTDEAFLKLVPKTMVNYFDVHDDEFCNPHYLIVGLLLSCVWFSSTGGIWTYIFNNFKLLRVLDFEGASELSGCKVPSDIGKLIHLRFLSLRDQGFIISKLPSSLGNLRCLQTLDLRIKAELSESIHLPNVIWRMEQLRHLYLPERCKTKKKLNLDTLTNLQTLVNFNTKYCNFKDLSKMSNLRVLEIRWHFNIGGFEGPDKSALIGSKYLHTLSIFMKNERIDPTHLAHLLSSCDCICKLSLEVDMRKLPEYHCFSQDIAHIHLSYCNLEEDPMPTLKKLPNLRILQFGDSAFTGKKMICSVGGFPRLDSLSLESLSNLEELQVDVGAIPVLRCLEIVNCRKMEMVPDGLSFSTTLQELAIKRMPKAFKDKLIEGGEDFNKVKHVRSITFQDC